MSPVGMHDCPFCGSVNTFYAGVDDGGGDYGESVCDTYRCEDCDNDFDGDCFSAGSDDGSDADLDSYYITANDDGESH